MVSPLGLKNKQNLTPEQRYLRPHISRVNELPNWGAPNWHAAPACRLINRHNISSASCFFFLFCWTRMRKKRTENKNAKQFLSWQRGANEVPRLHTTPERPREKHGTICGPVDPGKVSAFHCQSLCASAIASVNCLTDAQIRQTHPPPFFQVNEPVREQCSAYLKAHKHRKRETNPTVLPSRLHREFQVLSGSEKFAHLAQTECGTIQRKILWFGFQKHPTRRAEEGAGGQGPGGRKCVLPSPTSASTLFALRSPHAQKSMPLGKG